MSYVARIRRVSDGEERDCPIDLGWDGHGSAWWWTHGNYGCDCNRYLEFERAGSREDDPYDDDRDCTDGDYALVSVTLEDGTILALTDIEALV